MGKRDPGTIKSAHVDRDIQTVWVQVDYDDGGSQDFGGIELPDDAHVTMYIKDLCAAFGVTKLTQLWGKRCHALKCRGGYQESIEGLEAEDGTRFTFTGWRRQHGFKQPDVDLSGDYTDWSKGGDCEGAPWWDRLSSEDPFGG